jgi:hypothetical protein
MENKEKKDEKKEIRKLIDLPADAIETLKKKAKDNRMDVKSYMEKVLIDHAENPFKK